MRQQNVPGAKVDVDSRIASVEGTIALSVSKMNRLKTKNDKTIKEEPEATNDKKKTNKFYKRKFKVWSKCNHSQTT